MYWYRTKNFTTNWPFQTHKHTKIVAYWAAIFGAKKSKGNPMEKVYIFFMPFERPDVNFLGDHPFLMEKDDIYLENFITLPCICWMPQIFSPSNLYKSMWNTKLASIQQICTNSSNQGIYLKRKSAQHGPTFIIHHFHINTLRALVSLSVSEW